MPFDAFNKEWKKNNTIDVFTKIGEIAKLFKCGESVIARKALDSNKIEQKIYDKVIENAIEAYRIMKEKSESSGGNYYNTMGTRLDRCFVRALCESIQLGRTSYSEAYRLTNTSRKTFSQIAVQLGGAG